MPPEPFSWDRKEDFGGRKQERPESFSFGPRWRNSSATPYSSHYRCQDLPRLGSPDFRRPCNGKQSCWHQFEETSDHGCAPSCSSDRMYTPSVSCGDCRHGRNNNKGSFMQKDWKSHTCGRNNGTTDAIGRPSDMSIARRLVESTLTCPSTCHCEQMDKWDQSHSRDQHDNNASGNNGLNTGHRCVIETSLSQVDWKPLKWTRSGSLCSRDTGFSDLSSLKSLGSVASGEKDENLANSATLIQSPQGNAVPCITSTASSEGTSRKKPRLGWGEGLAKYEKKKVEGRDLNISKDGPVTSASSSEAAHSLGSSLIDKSPRIMGFTDCASPATPSSVACSSFLGVDENLLSKAAYANSDTNKICSSPCLGVWDHLHGSSFNLENLDNYSMVELASSLNELLRFTYKGSIGASFLQSTAMNRLLVWKGDVLKALEVTESEIDLLENELKRLESESAGFGYHPALSSSLPVVNTDLPTEVEAASTLFLGPAPLQLDSSADEIVDTTPTDCSGLEECRADAKSEDFDSHGTATPKPLEPLSLANRILPSKLELHVEYFEDIAKTCSADSMPSSSETCVAASDNVAAPVESIDDGDNILCSNILLCNKESARQASDILNKLSSGDCSSVNIFDLSNSCGWQDNPLIGQRFAARRRWLKFKEKVMAIKFKAFLNVWREDMHILSMRRCHERSQKKAESGLHVLKGGYSKHRTHIRLWCSSPGNLNVTPSPEMVTLASKGISNSPPRPSRDVLKMPSLVLEEKEKMFSRFVCRNGLVEDPCAAEKEKALVNPWTSEEKEIFMHKFANFGKDFRKISSFLDHKTTADCVEFYYKNHKSDCFKKLKKLDCIKQEKSAANTYLLTSQKKWNHEANAASLDILGTVSAMAARSDSITACRSKSTFRVFPGKCISTKLSKLSQVDDGIERLSSFDLPERETFAADILAGICSSFSSEVMSSCITNCIDASEMHRDSKSQKLGSGRKRSSMSDIIQPADDDTCSDDSCGEIDANVWTDEERYVFMQALSSYGKDFSRVSRCIGSKSQDQCRVFFSKARKRLGLDSILSRMKVGSFTSDDAGGDGSDSEGACVMVTSSAVSNDKLYTMMDEDLSGPPSSRSQDASDQLGLVKLEMDINKSEVEDGQRIPERSVIPDTLDTDDKNRVHYEGGSHTTYGDCDEGQTHPDQQTQDLLLSGDPGNQRDQAIADCTPFCTVASIAPCLSNFLANGTVSVTMEVSEKDPVLDRTCALETDLSKEVPKKHDVHTLAQDGLVSNGKRTSNHEVTTSLSLCFSKVGCQSQFPIEMRSTIPGFLSEQDTSVVSVKLESCDHDAFRAMDKPNKDTMSLLNTEKPKQGSECVGRLDSFPHISVHPLVNHKDSSQILRDYSLQIQRKKEMDPDVSCGQVPQVQAALKSDVGITNRCLPRGFSFHSCNGLMTEHPVFPSKQNSGFGGIHSRSLSDTDKPCRNGDVKLFGRILTTNGNEDEGFGHHFSDQSVKPSIVNFAGQDSSGVQWASMRIENGGQAGHGRSLGFWDGNRMQTGLSPLPDSAILLAKYPADFANYSATSSTKEKQVLHSLLKTSEHNLNGVSVYPLREVCTSDGVVASVMLRNHDGMNLGRDMMLSGMQSRNSLEALPSLQQTRRGITGMKNGGAGGVLGQGPCTGISDSVEAIRMHYEKTEQLIGQKGSADKEKEAWKGKAGDVGRL